MPRGPKPVTAAWIQRERKRLKGADGKPLSVAGLRERLALYDVSVTEQTIRVWEGNNLRLPGPDALDALERIFGSRMPNRETGPTPEGQAGLAAAITALVEELREWRQERETVEARLRAVESELQSLRAPQEGGASAALPVPPVEAGSGR